jgi:hypothetical protein
MSRRCEHSLNLENEECAYCAETQDKVVKIIIAMIYSAIESSPIDLREYFLYNIFFTCPGFEALEEVFFPSLLFHICQSSAAHAHWKIPQLIKYLDNEHHSHAAWIGASIIGSLSSYWIHYSNILVPKCLDDWFAVIGTSTTNVDPARRQALVDNVRFMLVLPDTEYHADICQEKVDKLYSPAMSRLSQVLPDCLLEEIKGWLLGDGIPLTSVRVSAGEAERREARSKIKSTVISKAATAEDMYAQVEVDYLQVEEMAWRERQRACINQLLSFIKYL